MACVPHPGNQKHKMIEYRYFNCHKFKQRQYSIDSFLGSKVFAGSLRAAHVLVDSKLFVYWYQIRDFHFWRWKKNKDVEHVRKQTICSKMAPLFRYVNWYVMDMRASFSSVHGLEELTNAPHLFNKPTLFNLFDFDIMCLSFYVYIYPHNRCIVCILSVDRESKARSDWTLFVVIKQTYLIVLRNETELRKWVIWRLRHGFPSHGDTCKHQLICETIFLTYLHRIGLWSFFAIRPLATILCHCNSFAELSSWLMKEK